MMRNADFSETDMSSVGYSSEPDEYESTGYLQQQGSHLAADQHEVYVGNTGKANFEGCHRLFRKCGFVRDMIFWRTHNHLYHCRVVYGKRTEADKAVRDLNHKMIYSTIGGNLKRIRVWHVLERVQLDRRAAIRIDGIAAEVSEEDIFDHFIRCGDIRFVVKVGFAAYIQFVFPDAVSQAFRLEMILNGEPYVLYRIVDDPIDHAQVIENTKTIKYRKPYVMVENYPELPFANLSQYKADFESIAPVRHFKIAPVGDKTVLLALCIDKADDRDRVMNRFNGQIVGNRQLKLYMAHGKVQMNPSHIAKYAICQNSIMVDYTRPYLQDYDVNMIFRRCGPISFLEKVDNKWIICFDSPLAVSLALNEHIEFIRKLEVSVVTPQTLQIVKEFSQQNPDGHFETLGTLLEKTKFTYVQPPANGIHKLQIAGPRPKPTHQKYNENGLSTHNTGRPEPAAFKNRLAIGNLPKGVEPKDLRKLFHPARLKVVNLYCSKDPYHGSAAAIVCAGTKPEADEIAARHHEQYRGKRMLIKHSFLPGLTFTPENSLMLKNLTQDIDEQYIIDEVEKILGPDTVDDVIKPTHHCAYFDLKEGLLAHDVIIQLQDTLKQLNIEVFPLYGCVPKIFLNYRTHNRKPLEELRPLYGALLQNGTASSDEKFGVHNGHKLFVGNIPRDTQTEDVVAYFNNYGNVIDYEPVDKGSCHLRKSAILSFIDSKHAQNAFCLQPHYLEGSRINIHLMDCPPLSFPNQDAHLLTVKLRSRYLTDDEIRHRLGGVLNVPYGLRFDAFSDQANYVARYKVMDRHIHKLEQFLSEEYINGEAVKIVEGYDPTPLEQNKSCAEPDIGDSPFRHQKEKYLRYIENNEKLKEAMKMRFQPSDEADIPFKLFHKNNSIQINNVSLNTKLENIRDLFIKCGDIVDYRALILEEDDSKICYVKFNTDLAAKLACNYNQRIVKGKRILVHLARETLVAERERSVLVERLDPSTTTENIYEAFSAIGTIKYVQKQSPTMAIVCFKDKFTILKAINLSAIPNSYQFIVSPCHKQYDPRLFNNFSWEEEHISTEHMRNTLKPRVVPQFHQLILEHKPYTQPEDINEADEVFLALESTEQFNMLPNHHKIFLKFIKTKYPSFTRREQIALLTPREQEKLQDVTKELQRYYKELKGEQDILPPAPKQARMEVTSPMKVEETSLMETEENPSLGTEDTPLLEIEETIPIKTEEPSSTNTKEASAMNTEETCLIKTEETPPLETEKTSRLERETSLTNTEETSMIKTEETQG